MKELTPEELALIASSNAKNKSANPASPPVYVVTGHPPGPGFPIPYFPSPSPITGGPGTGGGGGGGGGGKTPPPPGTDPPPPTQKRKPKPSDYNSVDYTDWGYVERHEHTNHPDQNPVHFQVYDDDGDIAVAAGVNITKHTAAEIKSWFTVDTKTADDLASYAGRTWKDLETFKPFKPIYSDAQLDEIQAGAQKFYQAKLSGEWNKYQSEHNSKEYQVMWKNLSHGVKAAMADIYWNTGNTRGDQPGDFWHEAFQQHWSAAATALNKDANVPGPNPPFTGENARRRLDDSAQIIEDLTYGDAPNYGG